MVALSSFSQNRITRPDFAHPETLSSQSELKLDKALASGDDIAALRAIINLTLAQNEINSDRMPGMLQRIDSLTQSAASPDFQSLLYLLQARIYSDIYNSERYAIQDRPTPPGELPADYNVWSLAQFAGKIIDLCNSATADERALLRRQLSEYKTVVTADRLTLIFYPRLYDFVMTAAIDMLRNLDTADSRDLAKELLQECIDFSQNEQAPYVRYMISSITDNTSVCDKQKFDELEVLNRKMGKSQYRIEAVLAMCDLNWAEFNGDKILYPLINTLIKSYPSYPRFNCLVNAASQLSRRWVHTIVPAVASPDMDITLVSNAANVHSATITLYRIPDSGNKDDSYYRPAQLSSLPVAATATLKFDGEIPFRGSDTLKVRLKEPGNYIAVARASGLSEDSRSSYRIIRCSRLSAGTISFDKKSAFVVDPVTGAPVAGAEIMMLPSNKTARLAGVTDDKGFTNIDITEGMRIRAVKGPDLFSPSVWFYPGNYRPEGSVVEINGFTSLPVYHPGDSVEWTFMAYEVKGVNHSPLSEKSITVVMNDANNQPVDTVTMVTDRYGRIAGRFLIPEGGLTGNFSLEARCGKNSRYQYFMVSDYKMPTFEVKISEIATGAPARGAVSLRGTAMTYSGVSVADAQVSVTLTKRNFWWRESCQFAPLRLEGKTDAEGRFDIIASAEELAPTGSNAWMHAQIAVTSLSGEMQQADKSFTLGSPLVIKTDMIPASINVADSVTLGIKIVDTADKVMQMNVNYQVIDSRRATVAEGTLFTPDSTLVDWSMIAPGTYTLRFMTDADTTECDNIALYNPGINVSPSEELLWTPDRSLTFEPGADMEILLGTLQGKTNVLYTLWSKTGVYEQRWSALEGGLNNIPVVLPDDVTEVTASFITTRDMRTQRLDVVLSPKVNPRKITMKVESMRDKLLPGQQERWTIRMTDAQGHPVEAAVMTEMYNQALDAIVSPSDWRLSVASPFALSLDVNLPSLGERAMTSLFAHIRDLRCQYISAPRFELYGLDFGKQTFRKYSRSLAVGMMNAMPMAKTMAVVEAVEVGAVKDELKSEDAADMEVEEEVANAATTGVAGAADGGMAQMPQVDYRDANVTLAFFRPMLRTDNEGNLAFEFTVPQANATWAFRALAYTSDLRTADINATVMSQKPVMVSANAPRFLRRGDRVTILTSVMNATEETRDVTVDLEISTTDGDAVARENRTVTLAPNATAYVPVTAEAGETLGLVLRAAATSGDFTDGERVLIPILEATQPVIGSRPFYMAPEEMETTIDMPAAPGSVTTLEFCANPEWYVVTALPGLRKGDILTAPAAADAIFSCAVAEGILRERPSIAAALKEWTESDKSEVAFTSMLERNEDMKALLLNATPWMMDARSQTERMERLALLFDKKEVAATYSRAIALLGKLTREDGGWAWIGQCSDPSYWATFQTLSILGPLNALGFFPDDKELKKMVSRAVSYIDSAAAEQVRKYPDSDMTSYTLLRDMYPAEKLSASAASIVGKTVQKCVANWTEWPLSAKPQAAMMLWRHDYQSVAREVLGSMSEFSESSPAKGTWFPSIANTAWGYLSFTADALDAYSMIEPDSTIVDGLRQWLVLQKQATEWGNTASASRIIASILLSSPHEVYEGGDVSVRVNDRDLSISAIDRRLGYVRTNIETGSLPAAITMGKNSETAAWGSVMRRSVERITEILPGDVEDLRIEKRILLPEGKTSIEVGDRLTVQLTIRLGRNTNYMTITDNRAAGLEPVDQTPYTTMSEGVVFYMEPRNSATNIFITIMPKGTYVLTYDVVANNAGEFSSGIANIQCQQAPELTAHSGGSTIAIKSSANVGK